MELQTIHPQSSPMLSFTLTKITVLQAWEEQDMMGAFQEHSILSLLTETLVLWKESLKVGWSHKEGFASSQSTPQKHGVHMGCVAPSLRVTKSHSSWKHGITLEKHLCHTRFGRKKKGGRWHIDKQANKVVGKITMARIRMKSNTVQTGERS